MTLTWVICGAGRDVGKTHLALRLCRVLPRAVYAKHGTGTPRPDKPPHFFRSADELAAFVSSCAQQYEHVVVESNEWAREGRGDVIIFVEGASGMTNRRPDADRLRRAAHLHTGPEAVPENWRRVLQTKLPSQELCEAICTLLADQQRFTRRPTDAVIAVRPTRVSTDTGRAVVDPAEVAVEQPLTIMVDGGGSFTLLCTPSDLQALVMGFLLTEGLIDSPEDCQTFSYRPEERVAAVRIEAPSRPPARNLIVTSSCGLCGSRNIDRLLSGGPVVSNKLRLRPATLTEVVRAMHARQTVFTRTGGTHAAAVFDCDGRILSLAEDIGRHNAVDKAIGMCLLEGRSTASCALALSGRVSLELVSKAARAGIELLAAVSSPSSLAISAAERCGITLCAFVREQRATVYTHPHRLPGLQPEQPANSGGNEPR